MTEQRRSTPLHERTLSACVTCVLKTNSNSVEMTEDVDPHLREAILRIANDPEVTSAAERWSKKQNPKPADAMNAVMFLSTRPPYDVMLLYQFVTQGIEEETFHNPTLILHEAVRQGVPLL